MSHRTRKLAGRGELILSRIVLMIGILAVVATWYVFSGAGSYEALMLPGLFSLALVGSVVGFHRVRARARWEAAWDAYAARERSRDPIGPYQEEGMLSMAGTR
jgi:hypothetical protein